MTQETKAPVEVYAWRGPIAGRNVFIPAGDVEAATAEDGWAQKLEPGTMLKRGGDPNARDPKWKIPGYEMSEGERAEFAKTQTADVKKVEEGKGIAQSPLPPSAENSKPAPKPASRR